ncbi:uncharacterized protein LOC120345493 [Styela clava]
MKLFVFVLLVLVCNASARKRIRGRESVPQPEGPCGMIQPFDQDFLYTYQYIAITEHRDELNRRGNDIKINCIAEITVPRRCSGKLRIKKCQVESGTMSSAGNIEYSPSPLSSSFDRDMAVSEMAFHFNDGQVTRIFIDKQERTNITNIKRGILSSLLAYNPELPKEFSVGDIYQVPQVSIYGQGIVQHKILEKTSGFPTAVEVTRDTSQIELPWERRQWNFIRMRNNRLNPIFSAIKNYITITNEERWARAKQICRYQLQRGRQVKSAICEERYPLNPIKPEIASTVLAGEPLETRIRQEVTMKTSRRMTSQDRSQWDVSRFDEDNIMFEEEWEETNIVYNQGFDAAATFLQLVRLPVNDKSPALVSKLSRWLAISSQEEIEAVWKRCESECTAEQKKDGRILWVELLNSCITNDWCQIPYCSSENSTTCENALESFISLPSDKSPEVKRACFNSLESIFAPSPKIVEAALKICRSEEPTTPECVNTLGAVTKNFLETCGSDCLNQKPVETAKSFLVRQLKKNCQTNNPETEEVMVAAAECLGRLGRKGETVLSSKTLLACAVNPEAPPRVAVKAIVAYGNTTSERLEASAMQKLVDVFTKKNANFETRVTCFHVLMKKDLPTATVEKILTTVMDENEHPSLVRHCRDDLRSQLVLRGTVFCNLHPQVAEQCARVILRKKWDIGISDKILQQKPVEKSYEISRNILIPYINVTSNCTVRLTSAYENKGSIMPIMSKLTVEAMINGRNMTILEAAMDIAGMTPVLDRIFGHNQMYAELFGKLLKTPMNELQTYAKQYPAWNELRDEAKFAYLASLFEPRSPVYLKVLGYPISLDTLTSFGQIRKLTLGSLWKIHEIIEDGFEHEKFVAGQPFLMQHASPTCIGAPIISTIDLSYVFKSKLNLRASIRRMISSPNEGAVLHIAPELHVTGSISRTILAQFSESCGTELQFKIGHGSAVDCTAVTNPTGVSFVCKPKPGKSQILYYKGRRSLTGPSAADPPASVCIDYRMRNLCNLQVCHQPFNEEGFAYELNIENEWDTEYQAEFKWETSIEPETKLRVKDMKVECTAVNRAAPSAKKVMWSSVIGTIADRGEMHWKIDCEWMKSQGKTDFLFYRNPETSLVEGCFSSFNRSSWNSLNIRHISTFGIVPKSAKRYVIFGGSKSLDARDEVTVGYRLTGALDEVLEGSNTSRKINVDFINMLNGNAPHLSYDFIAKKVPSAVDGMSGYETRTVLSGPSVPYYNKIECEMMTYDNEQRYEKVMRTVGHFGGDANPHFISHRIKGTLKQPGSAAFSTSTWLISNWLDLELEAEVDAQDDIVSHCKVNFPETPIVYRVNSEELEFAYSPQRYSGRSNAGGFLNYTFFTKRQPSGDRDFEINFGHKLWNQEEQKYKSERGTGKYTNYKECGYCHSFIVDHPKVKLNSVSRYNAKYFQEEKWLKLHYSLLDYITFRPYVSYYLINNLKNDYVQVGYKLYASSETGGPQNLHVSGALLQNAANCSALYHLQRPELVQTVCTIDAPMIALKSNMSFNVSVEREEKPLMSLRSETILGGNGCVLKGSLYYTKSEDIKGYLNATFGSYPALEHQSILDYSMLKSDLNSEYDISGSYKKTYRPRNDTQVYRYIGSSNKIAGGRNNLILKVLCPSESNKICGEVTLNEGDSWIQYRRLANEKEYDYASIKYSEGRNSYELETKMVNEIAWGVKHLNLTIKKDASSVGMGIASRICNASVRLSVNTGLEIISSFKTFWLQNKINVAANSASAKYAFYWNTVNVGGSLFSNNMSVNYAILNFDKPLDARIKIGSKPRAFLCDIKMTDLEFAIETGRDSERPTEWRYLCDARIRPNKMSIENLRIPFFYGREIEMAHTTVGWEYQDGRLQGLSARDISFTVSSSCRGSRPIEVKGSCDISFDKIIVKLSDPGRNFVLDVLFDPSKPMQHHFEYVISIMNSRIEMMWDNKKENNKWITTSMCELSRIGWETKSLSPVFTISCSNELGETPETANFPPMNFAYKLNHSMWLPIPREISITMVSTVSGTTSKIALTEKIGTNYYTSESTTTMTECYKRMTILPGISVCVPSHFDSDITYTLPFLEGQDRYVISKSTKDEWSMSMDSKFKAPQKSGDQKAQMIFNTNVEISDCPESFAWCIPKKVHLKDIKLTSSKLANEITLDYLPFSWFYRPREISDLELRNSDILFSREESGDSNVHQISYNFRKPGTNLETAMSFTATLSPNKLKCDVDLSNGDWHLKHNLETSCNPETWAWDYKHSLECPWMTVGTTIKASNLISISSCEMTLKMPNGIIRNLHVDYTTPRKISCQLDLAIGGSVGKGTHEMSWDPATMEWQCHDTINCKWMNLDYTAKGTGIFLPTKMDLTMKTVGWMKEIDIHYGGETPPSCVCKFGTVEFELGKTGKQYKCKFGCGSLPALNQTIYFESSRVGLETNWDVRHECQYSTCTAKLISQGYKVDPKEVECRMKNSQAGGKIEYVKESGGQLCRMTFKSQDGSRISCQSTPMANENSRATLDCHKLQGSERTKFASMPVTMQDFPFMGDYLVRDKVVFLARCVEYLYKVVTYSEIDLAEDLQKTIQCTNKNICREIAEKIKGVHQSCLNEMKRISGPKMYYIIKPEIGEYVIHKSLSYIPGYVMFFPTEQSFSPSSYVKKLLAGGEISLVHWNFQPYVEIKTGIKLEKADNFVILAEIGSQNFQWLNGGLTIGTEEVEGERIANVTVEINPYKARVIARVSAQSVRILTAEACAENCQKSVVLVMNQARTSDGRNNITCLFMHAGVAEYACDILTRPDDWTETNIKLYKGIARAEPIGQIDLPSVPKLSTYDYTDMDRVLREVLRIGSRNHRNEIKQALMTFGRYTTEGAYKTIFPRTYGMPTRMTHYILASILHEATKYSYTDEVSTIISKFLRKSSELDPNVRETYNDLVAYVSNIDITGELGVVVQNILAPVFDAVGYMLEGHVAATCEVENGEIIIHTHIYSSRFPMCNFTTTVRARKLSWMEMVVNVTTSNTFVKMSSDARLAGAKIYIDRVRFGLPEESASFIEVRMAPNLAVPGLYEIDIIVADNSGQHYGCRGGRPSIHTPILHFHCYTIEGEEIPRNPSSATMFAHWDLNIEDLPHASTGAITGTIRTMIVLFRTINACHKDTSSIDKTLLENFNIHDPKIRQRLANTFNELCRRWVNEFKSDPAPEPETGRENESKYVRAARQYKTLSYESMMSYVNGEVEASRGPRGILVWDFSRMVEIVTMMYPYCAPMIHYSAAVLEYVEPTGVFNVSRCTRCPTTLGKSKILMSMRSPRFPILNNKVVVTMTSEGVVNSSLSNDFAWGWMECEVRGIRVLPIKGRFGLATTRNGVEVVFWPEMSISEKSVPNPPFMSVRFTANQRYTCDARFNTWLSTDVKCHPYKSGSRGTPAAICNVKPLIVGAKCINLVSDAIVGNTPSASRIGRVIEDTCVVNDPAFKEAVSSNLARDISFISDYCRKQISSMFKAIGDIWSTSYSYIWKGAIEIMDWVKDMIAAGKRIDIRNLTNRVQEGIEELIGWCKDITWGVYDLTTIFYQSGFVSNQLAYELPEYITSVGDYTGAINPQYNQYAYYYYMKQWARNALRTPNCVSGMVSGNKIEQVISFNNYMYNMPKRVRKCSYLLAGEERKFTVTLEKNEVVMHLPDMHITIAPDMKVYLKRVGEQERREVSLPMFVSPKVSCARTEDMMMCWTPYFNLKVHCQNNVRTSFFVDVAEEYCPKTFGMFGKGGNTTAVREREMTNGQVAPTMEAFIEYYSTDKSCHVGTVPPEPEVSHEHCDRLFNNDEWMQACPDRRRSFMKACQTGASSTMEACRYVTEYNWVCKMEGKPVKMAPKCEACKGKKTVGENLDKVRVTVLMALNRKTSIETTPEILEAVRSMANREGLDYEISFVTFGGMSDRSAPHFNATGGMVWMPRTMPWNNIPVSPMDGPNPSKEIVEKAMCFAYNRNKLTAEGYGKIFLVAAPEDMDLSPLMQTECVKDMKNDLIESYLLIPTICKKMGAKTGARMGVRPLLTNNPTNICKRTADQVATEIKFSNANKRVTCTCTVMNPIKDTCTPAN